jgi:excisionase family DNA binding protein
MENVIQVHGMTKDELLNDFSRLIDQKLNQLQKSNNTPKKHSIKELSKYCGVSQNTVRNWIAEGKVKAERLGGRIFITEEEFQKALSEVKSQKYQRV